MHFYVDHFDTLKSETSSSVLFLLKQLFRLLDYQILKQNLWEFLIFRCTKHVKVKVKQSRYRPGVAQRVPGS